MARKTFRFTLSAAEHAALLGLAHERGESVAYLLREMIRAAWAKRERALNPPPQQNRPS